MEWNLWHVFFSLPPVPFPEATGQAEPAEITEFLLFFSVYSVRDLMARVRITPKKCKLSNEGCPFVYQQPYTRDTIYGSSD